MLKIEKYWACSRTLKAVKTFYVLSNPIQLKLELSCSTKQWASEAAVRSTIYFGAGEGAVLALK